MSVAPDRQPADKLAHAVIYLAIDTYIKHFEEQFDMFPFGRIQPQVVNLYTFASCCFGTGHLSNKLVNELKYGMQSMLYNTAEGFENIRSYPRQHV